MKKLRYRLHDGRLARASWSANPEDQSTLRII